MTSYEFGDVLLLNAYPFSDLTGVKKRPALVVADIGDEDVLVARITSEEPRDDHDVSLERWKAFGLILPSTVRISKVATLTKKLVLRKMGKLGSPERRKVRTVLRKMFAL
jgi:mRNA interferase MazF